MSKLCKVVVAAVAVALLLPAAALAVTNAYGYVYAGESKCLDCHGGTTGRRQVGTYVDTAHGRFVTDVQRSPASIVPAASSSMWPSPTLGGGLNFGPTDMQWLLGAPGMTHEYVTKFKNDGSHVLSTGQTMLQAAGPADDWMMANSLGFLTEEGTWELAKIVGAPYFQKCGGCHFTGITRPSDKTYALPSGATESHDTTTGFAGVGIQCEACHGTGKAGAGDSNHEATGVRIVRTKQVLQSQTCGQCHVNGTAKQKSYLGGTFSSPNGFTPDQKLEDYFDVAGVQYIKTGPSVAQPSIPTTDSKFYPNGANKGMGHGYYNEWMLSGHARSLRYKNGALWSTNASNSCLPCHSGEGFLKSLGYGWEGLYQTNDIGVFPSTVGSDTLDVECAVCHTVHAKTGDALGLRLPKNELCGRCHNGGIADGQPATAGSHPHHASKEMRAGYGLIGVEPTGAWMADTSCPDCHMPTTRSTRVSHSFKPMLPGNAEAWGVHEYGDSCTPCHRSRTREQLQTDIDGWQNDVTARLASANNAIAAAKSRAAATTASGKTLIDAAQTNAWFVQGDGSNGVHNYPYAKAGLDEAALLADAVGANFAEFGMTAADASSGMSMAYGRLVLGDGSPAIGQTVAIEEKPAGTSTWRSVGNAVTTATGGFAYAVKPAGTASYRALWRPIAGTAIGSATRTVTMGSRTSIARSASSVHSGYAVKISGAVSPTHAGRTVAIQYRYGATWRTLATRTLDANSRYSFSWRPRTIGTCYLRTVFGGDVSHVGSKSGTLSLRVYQ